MMTMRQDSKTDNWSARPWIMAAICALAGLLGHVLTDVDSGKALPWRQAGATFVSIAALSFVLTVEQRRWNWSLYFALGWGLVVAMVGWFTVSYNQDPTIFEWPFLSGLFAVLLAAPLFQTVRDEGAWRFPYAQLHGHAWNDAVIGVASLAFVGVTFILSWLIAGLFDLIGIDVIKRMLREPWFMWTLGGFAFGAAVGLLRERDGVVGTLQRLVMVVLGVLAPVLAVALVIFLLSLPFTGLAKLWDSPIPATPMMLLAGAGAILLANAVIGNGKDDRATSWVLRIAALALVLSVLPLAIIAAVSLGQRIGQYGWTPERIWGVVAVAVAIAYGVAGWWSAIKGRQGFDDQLRPLQTRMAIGLCGLALLLALPIIDFGAVSASSQMARLTAGKVDTQEFDWTAMAFDFGPTGRRTLQRIAIAGTVDQRRFATSALNADDRYAVSQKTAAVSAEQTLNQRLQLLSDDILLTDALKQRVSQAGLCRGEARCALMRVDRDRLLLIVSYGRRREVTSTVIDLAQPISKRDGGSPRSVPSAEGVDLEKARIELREVSRRQLYVDGKPVGLPIE